MGIIVYFHDRKSVSNILFFLVSLFTVFWSLANYFSITVQPAAVLQWIRWVLFFAVPLMMSFFLFIFNFPEPNLKLPLKYLIPVFTATVITMALTISPLVFVNYYLEGGRVVPVAGPLMPLFALVVIAYLVASLILMVKKYLTAKDLEKKQWRAMVVGVFSSFFLLVVTNFLFVVVFNVTYFVKLGPLLMLPAVFGMGYAIMKHHLLNVKAIATEILTFAILSISLFEVLTANGLGELLLRVVVFSLFFMAGIFLIRSVLKEVEQREKLEILTKELEAANTKLKELDKLKSEFLSFASHQVKAPMAVVKGFASLIHEGSYGEVPDKVRESSQKIIDAADRMVSLVNNLLDLRKIEEGKMTFKFEKADISKLVSDVTEEFRSLAEGRGLAISIELNAGERMANIDTEKFRQVVQNLIDNSIKYTETGWVKVSVNYDAKGFILITISDSGRGMSKELLPQLFEQFHRDPSMPKQIAGTGLGLYIARQIMLAHKGEVWAESDGEGKGSRFLVKIPVT